MRNINRKKEAVSPVIAVILMVAITVVLAAVLYVMVSGLVGDTSTTPHISLMDTQSADGFNWSISMTGFSSEILLKDIEATLVDSAGVERASITDFLADADATNGTLNDARWILVFNKGTATPAPTELTAAQSFFIIGANANTLDGTTNYAEDYQLKLIYKPTGDAIDTVTLK